LKHWNFSQIEFDCLVEVLFVRCAALLLGAWKRLPCLRGCLRLCVLVLLGRAFDHCSCVHWRSSRFPLGFFFFFFFFFCVFFLHEADAKEKAGSAVGLERALLGAEPRAVGSETAATLSPDFSLLLGLADALSPGTFTRLAGDPDALETKFFELFDSF
jgi:hypothetical protein